MVVGHHYRQIGVNEFGLMIKRKTLHKAEFACDIVDIHSLMIYTDLIEYNIGVDTEAQLLYCFPNLSELKTADNIATG